MTSSYLLRVRPAREILAQLIAAREIELSRTTEAEECRLIACELDWLRRELVRLESGCDHET